MLSRNQALLQQYSSMATSYIQNSKYAFGPEFHFCEWGMKIPQGGSICYIIIIVLWSEFQLWKTSCPWHVEISHTINLFQATRFKKKKFMWRQPFSLSPSCHISFIIVFSCRLSLCHNTSAGYWMSFDDELAHATCRPHVTVFVTSVVIQQHTESHTNI